MTVKAVAAATGAAKEARTFPGMLKQYRDEIARALPKHINADRMARIALTAFRKNPKLGDCVPESVFAAVIMGAQLGLEPDIMGQAYLVPYGKECQFIPGWQGYADLVARAGRASVWTGAVYDGDDFDYALGDTPFVKHRPSGEDDPAKLLYVYAVGRIKNSDWPVIEVWNRKKIEKHRDRFNKVGARHYSYQHFEMYGRKVALMQVIKYMPKSVELARAVELEQAAATGEQKLDLTSVIEGTWSAPAPEEGGETKSGDYVPYYTDETAIAALKEATSLDDLGKRWAAIVKDYADSKRPMHVSIEAVKNEKREALENAV